MPVNLTHKDWMRNWVLIAIFVAIVLLAAVLLTNSWDAVSP